MVPLKGSSSCGDVASHEDLEDLAILVDADRNEGLDGQPGDCHLPADPMGLIQLCYEHLRFLIFLPRI